MTAVAAGSSAGSLLSFMVAYLVYYIKTRDEKKDAADFKELTTSLSASIEKLKGALDAISNNLSMSAEEQKIVMKMQKDLWDWHNIHDEDGVKRWYHPRGLETSIKELSKNIATQTRILERIGDRLESQDEKLNKILDANPRQPRF